MSGTENDILSGIPDIHDDSGDSGADSSGYSGQSDGGGSSTTSAQPETSSAAPPQSNQQTVRRRHDGLVEVPNEQNPNTRDLVDPISGRRVAQGGIERRIYEEGQRHARENNALKQQLAQATQQLTGINEVTQEAVRLNVAPQDQLVAIRMMSEFLRDPVRTLETLVAEVKSKGYPIPFLEQGIHPGIDVNAIGRMIDNKMAPLTQQQEAARQQAETRQRAEAEINNFLSENEEANNNLDVIGEMLQAQPGLTLQGAWTKMIRWAHENQLDWTQSLKEQIARQRQQPTPQQQPTNQRPLPGARSVNASSTPVNNGAVQQYHENSSWADIIRQSMQDHGVNFS